MKIIFIFLFLFIPHLVFGAAFLIYNQDVKANSMGMAASASIDNSSAVFYNPAILPNLKGFGFLVGDIIAYPKMTYKDPISGESFVTKSGSHHIPHLYMRYTKERFSAGIGVFSPFGLSTEWPKNWIGRYNIVYAGIKTTFLNPVMAYKINDVISIGGGISYVKSEVTFKNAINLFPLQDGLASLSGHGDGIGYNGAALFNLPRDFALSLTYRSPVKIKYRGRANFYLPPPFAPISTEASTRLTLPFIFATGIAKKTEKAVFEADILYTGWSSMSHYRISSDNGMADGFFYKNWRNSMSIALGMNYLAGKNTEARAGYMYDRTPIPKKTLGPELPDSTRHIFTMGMTYKKGDYRINLGYQATFFNDTRSYLTGLDGKYSGFAHLVMLGLGFEK
ncbi:MAG TPA: outer membrane protein transport protein [Syntrophorhabdaceae bacterium]|nr:outer membrane protein transport protein [Syntrophorhabdaceae bacterium]